MTWHGWILSEIPDFILSRNSVPKDSDVLETLDEVASTDKKTGLEEFRKKTLVHGSGPTARLDQWVTIALGQ